MRHREGVSCISLPCFALFDRGRKLVLNLVGSWMGVISSEGRYDYILTRSRSKGSSYKRRGS